jgi:quercetin dioxygenase-like cupin family protein
MEERMSPVVNIKDLVRAGVQGAHDKTVHWSGGFAAYGGSGAEDTCVVYYEIEPGGHLGWHTDSLEETQFIVEGTGELHREDGAWPAGPGSIFVLPALVRHDLANTGADTLRGVAFFSGAVLVQEFDEVMLPPDIHTLRSPNATGQAAYEAGDSTAG